MTAESDWSPDSHTSRLLQDLAQGAAPEVVQEALAGARAEAKAILQRQLVSQLLHECETLLPAAVVNAPTRAGPAQPAQSNRRDDGSDGVAQPASLRGRAPDHPGPDRPGEATVCARSRPTAAGRPPRPAHDQPPGSWYLYGITDAAPDGATGLAGVDGARTETLLAGDLVAVVSAVNAGNSAWTEVTGNGPELEALTPLLRAHERVLEDLLDSGPVLPVRFGLTFADAGDILGLLRTHEPAIRAALDRVRGKAEWGLNLSWDEDLASRSLSEPDATAPADINLTERSAGRRYLDQRRTDRRRAANLDALRNHLAATVHDRLAELSCGAVAHRPEGRRGGGRPGRQPLLRASYLIARDQDAAFRSAIERELSAARECGLAGELTGPWAPYHFVSLEAADLPT